MAFDPLRKCVVLFGGSTINGGAVGDTWEWDGEYWIQVSDLGPQPRFYLGEIGGGMAVNFDTPNTGPRISIYSGKGEMLARLGQRPPGLRSLQRLVKVR